MTEFVYEALLSVHAENEEEADQFAREARDFLNDPVLFGCGFNPGGDIAPPVLRLGEGKPSVRRAPDGGAR